MAQADKPIRLSGHARDQISSEVELSRRWLRPFEQHHGNLQI